MQVVQFREFCFKTPIHARKIGGFERFDRLSKEQYQRNLQKAHPWAKRCHMTYKLSKAVRRCDLCAWQSDQKWNKDKKETRLWQTGYSPRPPVPSDRHEILRGGWSSGGSPRVRISSKSVKRFRSCWGGSKFAHSHWLGFDAFKMQTVKSYVW